MPPLWFAAAPRPMAWGSGAAWRLFARDAHQAWCVVIDPPSFIDVPPHEFAVTVATLPISQVAEITNNLAPAVEPALQALLEPHGPADPSLAAFFAVPVTVAGTAHLGIAWRGA